MFSEDKRVAIVFNGEIYNFPQLRSELESEGYLFRGNSDTEVLLNLYLSYKHRNDHACDPVSLFLRRLNGVFAFALWDEDRQALLIARDALGVKPLYYQYGNNGLYFSSEIKALPIVPLTLDPSGIDSYLSYLWSPGKATPVNEVRKLGPGEAMWVAQGDIQEHLTWYRLPIVHLPNRSSPQISEEQAIRGTEEHLRQAVHRQLVSDVPVGAFLSGV